MEHLIVRILCEFSDFTNSCYCPEFDEHIREAVCWWMDSKKGMSKAFFKFLPKIIESAVAKLPNSQKSHFRSDKNDLGDLALSSQESRSCVFMDEKEPKFRLAKNIASSGLVRLKISIHFL